MSRIDFMKLYPLISILVLLCLIFLSVQSARSAVESSAFTDETVYPAPETLSPEIFYTPTRRTYPGEATLPPAAATALPSASQTLQPSLTPTLAPSTQEATGSTQAVTITPPTITTGSQIETATLIPLPALTLIFPEQKQASILITATPDTAQESGSWATPQRIVPLALILIIWIILGGWFYYSQRNLG